MKLEIGFSAQPFTLDLPARGPMGRMFSWMQKPLEKLFWLDDLNRLYAHARQTTSRDDFLQTVLERLNTRASISQIDLDNIPKTGPVVVVANHPFGAIEGIILARLLQSVRPDIKVMANYLLHRIPELRDLFIFVDPFGGPDAARANIRGLRQSIDWVKTGGMLAVFPAGTVSHLNIKRREITDPLWSDNVARIVRRTGAAVLPVYFEGANSTLFQMAGLLHSRLRTAMLPRELFNRRRGTINIRAGRPIPFKKLRAFEDDRRMTDLLRRRTYLLRYRDHAGAAVAGAFAEQVRQETIVPAVDPALLSAEIAALPRESTLFEAADQSVILASAAQMPGIMREIGRLREITFRLTGEGTGKSIDLDEFDSHYSHLFVWNKSKCEIVGAYRLGFTDKILAERGPAGLYTSTLFRFKPRMLKKLNPAIEMGRSFVRPEYQRRFSPLLLLWKGIGHVVGCDPKYRLLFGPVSISNTYNTISRQLMVTFLRMQNYLPDLSRLIKARHPFNSNRAPSLAGGNIDEISALVSEIESDQKGIPVLIKQYLKLGGNILAFNVDPNFSDVVDGLIYVDLTRTDPRVLDRYLGKKPAEAFLRYHGRDSAAANQAELIEA